MMQCDHLECHYIGTCEMQARAKCMELCQLLWHEGVQTIKYNGIEMLWGIAWLTCMQNVGTCGMLGGCLKDAI
jgi:hypothetical protein